MPNIKPVSDLRNYNEVLRDISVGQPVFLTKNGYGDMVIMSMETYEKALFLQRINAKVSEAEKQIENGEVLDAKTALKKLRGKYEV